MQSQKIWKHDVTGFKFRSHGAKGRQIPRGECVKHNLRVVRVFTRKSEKIFCWKILLIVTSYY